MLSWPLKMAPLLSNPLPNKKSSLAFWFCISLICEALIASLAVPSGDVFGEAFARNGDEEYWLGGGVWGILGLRDLNRCIA